MAVKLDRELFSLQKLVTPKSSQTREEWLQSFDDNPRVVLLYTGEEENKQSSNIKDAQVNYLSRLLARDENKLTEQESMKQLATLSKNNIDEIVDSMNETRAIGDLFHKCAEKKTTKRATLVKAVDCNEHSVTFEVCFAEADFSGSARRTLGVSHGRVDAREECKFYRILLSRVEASV